MRKYIDEKFCKKVGACKESVTWVKENIGKRVEKVELIKQLIKHKRYDDANWIIARIFNREQRIHYACYAAKQVLHIYEKEYPDDKRPRQAINAALKCIKNNTEKNRAAAASAAGVAYAAYAAYVTGDNAYAAYAAGAAANAAAYGAANAAYAAANAAAYGADMRIKILKYGIKLLKENL